MAKTQATYLVAVTVTADDSDVSVSNLQTLQQRAQNALEANANFLGLSSPTSNQAVAQIQTLTRECSAIIRLLFGLFDDISGT